MHPSHGLFDRNSQDEYLKLRPLIDRLNHEFTKEESTPYEFMRVPFDNSLAVACKKIQNALQSRHKQQVLVVIGIGGSHLAAAALYSALALTQPVYFIDTLAPLYTQRFIQVIKDHLEQKHWITCIIISKSGTTVETSANAAIFVELIGAYQPLSDSLIIISDEHSPLAELAHKNTYHFLAIPALVGGRFSAFTAVALMPLLLAGVDIVQFQEGARSMSHRCLQPENNPAVEAAHVMVTAYTQGKNIYDIFVMDPDLYVLGLWYRQLIGESLGKNMQVGITPTVSVATNDLHSVAQLYLAGPDDKFTLFLEYAHDEQVVQIPHNNWSMLSQLPQQVTISELHSHIVRGVYTAFEIKQRTFGRFALQRNPYILGEFLQLCMFQIVYAAQLLEVDPFNQPEVELYKQETRKLLQQSKF